LLLSYLFFDPFFQKLAGGLDLRDIFKGVLGDHEKRAGIEINVEEVDRLLKRTEVLPAPQLIAFLGFEQNALIGEAQHKIVFKGSRAFVNAQRKEPADSDPEAKPQKRKNKEGYRGDLLENQQEKRNKGKHIDDDDQDPDFKAPYKVAPEAIHYFLFVVAELYSHIVCPQPESFGLATGKASPATFAPLGWASQR
jgi:hypothetical protein